MIPTLTTERLTLRAPTLEDFAPYAAFYASDATAFIGGPQGERDAWRHFSADMGHWHLKGYGWFTLDDGEGPVGTCGLHQPPTHPDPELGWLLYERATGKGYATEAARAVLDWQRGALALPRIVSHIDVGNAPSLAVARRLGATTDGARAAHDPACEMWVHGAGTVRR